MKGLNSTPCRLLRACLFIFLLQEVGGSARADPETDADNSVVASAAAISRYLFRGQRLDGFSFQSSVELDASRSFLGIWNNLPLDSKNLESAGAGSETDLYGAYTLPLLNNVETSAGFTLYRYHNRSEFSPDQTVFEPNLALDWSLGGIKFGPKVYYDVEGHRPTFEGNASAAFPLKRLGTELDLAASFGASFFKGAIVDGRSSANERSDYWKLGATLPFQVATRVRIVGGWTYEKGWNVYPQSVLSNRRISLAASSGVASLSCLYTF